LPNKTLLQETPSSTAINPSAAPTNLAIDENVFEVGPIRDLLVEIKREFAKGRNWGLKPAVFHEMGAVTYSLLLYEKRDIAETEISSLLITPLTVILVAFSFSYFCYFNYYMLEFIPEFILEFYLEFILFILFILDFLTHTFNFPPNLFYIIFILICGIISGVYWVAMAGRIWVFVKSNKFWTHGHLQLRLNDHVYDHTWAAIGTKEFRALKLELRATESPIVSGVNEAQKGLLRCVFASLPMEFRSSEVRRRIVELSEAEHVGPSVEAVA
jgi:hypothetical protein